MKNHRPLSLLASLLAAFFSATVVYAAEQAAGGPASANFVDAEASHQVPSAHIDQVDHRGLLHQQAPSGIPSDMREKVERALRGEAVPGHNPAADQDAGVIEGVTVEDQAFANLARQMFPLAPEQIKELRRLFNETQKASAFVQDVPPRPTSRSVIADLSPGAVPPVIRLTSGYVTSLVFLDASGAPWPIKAYDLGNPNSFNIQWDQKGNTLLMQAITMYKEANLAVMLQGLNTPLMITLLPGQRAVDYRVDMHVPRLGPKAKPEMQRLPSAANPELLDVLNGIAPTNSQRLLVAGGDCDAWVRGSVLMLRTPLTIVSPSWVSKISSSDGMMHAYQLHKASVVLALDHGKMQKLTLEGFK